VCNDNKAKRRSAFPAVWLHDMYARGGSRKKILGEGAGPSSFGRQQRLSEINIEPIASTSSRTTLSNCPVLIWGHGQDLGACAPCPNIEPPLMYACAVLASSVARPLCENMTSSTKPEVHNVLFYAQPAFARFLTDLLYRPNDLLYRTTNRKPTTNPQQIEPVESSLSVRCN